MTDTGGPWAELLVGRIERGDEQATAEMCRVLSDGVRFLLHRKVGQQDLEDRTHNVLTIVIQAIRDGSLRDPSRLMGFVRTVIHRQGFRQVEECVNARLGCPADYNLPDAARNPEQEALHQEKLRIAGAALALMEPRDREILERFYLLEHPAAQICEEMGMTPTQFRLAKSRAKAEFGEYGKRAMSRIPSAAVMFDSMGKRDG